MSPEVAGMVALALDSLHALRLERWRQTPQTKIANASDGAALIGELGVVTAFPAWPEVPNLYSAHVGDPDRKTEMEWDSPSGTVYTWRWELGRANTAFYGVIVRRRPTFVAWPLLPSVLRLWGELRTPDELFDLGKLSANAYRIVQALEEAGGTLTTRGLREAAEFPLGSRSRCDYLKAVDELDGRLLLGKVFEEGMGDGDEMAHALVSMRWREHADAADRLTRDEALRTFLCSYLPAAVYVLPTAFARRLKMDESEVRACLERLADDEQVERVTLPGQKGLSYVWRASSAGIMGR
jgi:hypothetical protein